MTERLDDLDKVDLSEQDIGDIDQAYIDYLEAEGLEE